MRNKTGLQAAGDNTFSLMCEREAFMLSWSVYVCLCLACNAVGFTVLYWTCSCVITRIELCLSCTARWKWTAWTCLVMFSLMQWFPTGETLYTSKLQDEFYLKYLKKLHQNDPTLLKAKKQDLRYVNWNHVLTLLKMHSWALRVSFFQMPNHEMMQLLKECFSMVIVGCASTCILAW